MGRKGNEKLYALVDDLVSIGERDLVTALGISQELARDLMRTIAHSLCMLYARSYMYVPVDMEFELSRRDKEIWRKYGEDSPTARKFTPARIAELAAEYAITTVQVYCIVRLMLGREKADRAREMAERQAVLPGIEDAYLVDDED